jgi:hypothetical protein
MSRFENYVLGVNHNDYYSILKRLKRGEASIALSDFQLVPAIDGVQVHLRSDGEICDINAGWRIVNLQSLLRRHETVLPLSHHSSQHMQQYISNASG